MICAIHQPQYLPWLGYFDKMRQSDVFVLLDNVQFKKNEWQNRNRIRTSGGEGWQWLTVPVLHDFGQAINEVKLNPNVDWRGQHVRSLMTNYARAPFYKEYWPSIAAIYDKEWSSLGELNIFVVRLFAQLMGIKTKIILSSELPLTSVKTQRLIDICRLAGCDTYLAGAGAEAYMDFELFKSSGLNMRIQQYDHPCYPQLWCTEQQPFISHLSVVDWLFNMGSSAAR